MGVNLSPVLNDQQLGDDGLLLTGGKIETYLAGSSTPEATYTSAAGDVPQSNPIILNTLGQVDSLIWLTEGITYKFVLKDANNNIIKTYQNISGVNDTSTTADQWIASGATPTYVNANKFTLAGDQTSTFEVGRRVKATVTSGTVYGTITASAYDALTTVTVVLDSGVLDSGLSTVSYGLLTNSNNSIPAIGRAPFVDSTALVKGSADASKLLKFEVDNLTAATTRTAKMQDKDITVADIGDINALMPFSAALTANTLVGTLSASIGLPFSLGFRSATLSLGGNNNIALNADSTITVPTAASLGLTTLVGGRIAHIIAYSGGAPVYCVANADGNVLDESRLISPTVISAGSTSSNAIYSATVVAPNSPYRIIGYSDVIWTSGVGYTTLTKTQPAGGISSITNRTPSMVRVNTANGYGSTNTCIPRYTTVLTNQGTDITYADSATLGASFTINTPGFYAMNIVYQNNQSSSTGGISLNSNQLTAQINTITVAHRLSVGQAFAANALFNCAATVYLQAGDVIRPHSDGNALTASLQSFNIVKVF